MFLAKGQDVVQSGSWIIHGHPGCCGQFPGQSDVMEQKKSGEDGGLEKPLSFNLWGVPLGLACGGAARVSIEPQPAVNPGALSESVPSGNLAPGAY